MMRVVAWQGGRIDRAGEARVLGNRRMCLDESAVSALAALRRLAEDCTKPLAMLP